MSVDHEMQKPLSGLLHGIDRRAATSVLEYTSVTTKESLPERLRRGAQAIRDRYIITGLIEALDEAADEIERLQRKIDTGDVSVFAGLAEVRSLPWKDHHQWMQDRQWKWRQSCPCGRCAHETERMRAEQARALQAARICDICGQAEAYHVGVSPSMTHLFVPRSSAHS